MNKIKYYAAYYYNTDTGYKSPMEIETIKEFQSGDIIEQGEDFIIIDFQYSEKPF